MATITDPQDVKDGYESSVPFSDAWLTKKIIEAELILSERLGDLSDWIAANPTLSEERTQKIKTVVTRMVTRVIRNPEGYTSEADGDYSYSRGRSTGEPGDVYASTGDWRLLGVSSRRARGSVRVSVPLDSPRNMNGYCP